MDTWRDGGTWALLLTSQAFSAGLTLTEANYCFILEPQPRLRDELQIFARCCSRMSQQRETHLYRFYMCGTKEERIMRRNHFLPGF